MKNNRLAIVGAGGHGRVVADRARLMGCWSDIIFFDEKFGYDQSFETLMKSSLDEIDVFVAIGNNAVRKRLTFTARDVGFHIPVIRHPASITADDCSIGEGSVMMAGAILNPGTKLGRGCVINTGASVDHDCVLADFVHIAPGAHLAGTVSIKETTWIGIGAVVCENKTVGRNVMVAAGAVVITNVPDNMTVMGVPAK